MRIHSPQVVALATLLIIGAVSDGCTRYGGGAVGSEAISDNSTKHICYAYQLPPPSSTSPSTPVFLVLWLAKQAGSATTGPNNLLTEIHGHPISPDLDRKAVYALQPDYSLRELALTPAEIEHLFSNRREAECSDEEEHAGDTTSRR